MKLSIVVGLLRGSGVWLLGYVVTLIPVILGFADGRGSVFRVAGEVYLAAHVVPGVFGQVSPLVAVPFAVVGVAGYRLGSSLKTGLVGRLRSAVRSFRGRDRHKIRLAVETVAVFAAGYTVAATIAAIVLGALSAGVIMGSFAFCLGVGIPASIVGMGGLPTTD